MSTNTFRVSLQHKSDVIREMFNELRRVVNLLWRMITGEEVDDKSGCEGHSKPQILGVLHCRLDVNACRLEVLFDKRHYSAATSFDSIFTQAYVT